MKIPLCAYFYRNGEDEQVDRGQVSMLGQVNKVQECSVFMRVTYMFMFVKNFCFAT